MLPLSSLNPSPAPALYVYYIVKDFNDEKSFPQSVSSFNIFELIEFLVDSQLVVG